MQGLIRDLRWRKLYYNVFMKYHITVFALISVLTTSCVMVETGSLGEEFDIKLIKNEVNDTFDLGFYHLSTFEVCPRSSEGIYFVKFPQMRGGYSKFLFLFTFNEYDPYEYKILSLIKNNKEFAQFSIDDILKLEHDTCNVYYLDIDKINLIGNQ